MKPPGIEQAIIQWDDDSTPASSRFGDVYFSRDSGENETTHVFLNGNRLQDRFAALPAHGHFVVAETGFGSGLNFLLTWKLWQQVAPKTATLHFVSVEKFPMSAADFQRAHQAWPSLAPFCSELQQQYPEPVTGTHRLQFAQDRVYLTLFHGDVIDWLRQCGFQADAWFLDGFSPKANPDMWSPTLFGQIATHSAESASFATFSAAGFIRRGLAEAGFSVSKVPGFGRKRDMTIGHLATTQKTASIRRPAVLSPEESRDAPVVVIGSGLAGATTARTLQQRGYRVKVLEKSPRIAAGASGNPQGALYIKLAVDWNPGTRIHLSHYLYAVRSYNHLLNLPADCWQPCGVIQLAYDEREQARQEKFLQRSGYPVSVVYPISAAEASAMAGIQVAHNALHFPQGGWLSPVRLCEQLLDHPDIEVCLNTDVISLSEAADGHWQLRTAEGHTLQASAVVIAAAEQSRSLLTADACPPFKPIRGQIDIAQAVSMEAFPLSKVICGEGYVLPPVHNTLVYGATFKPNNSDPTPSQDDSLENRQKLRGLLADCPDTPQPQSRASVRCALPDYLPAVGQVANTDRLLINTAFGSKGLTLAPLAAELLADLLQGVPCPLEDELIQRLSPGRFSRQPDKEK